MPDGTGIDGALGRTTHLGIGAHQDDLEFITLHGILECFGRSDRWFTGVTSTDGAGSPRSGVYANYSDEEMMALRREEQRQAAAIGRYSAVLQLMYSSAEAKNPSVKDLPDDFFDILRATRPQIVYTHNPADKHATHVAVVTAVLTALRKLPAEDRPARVYGCEAWRDLDWLPDDRKVVLDTSGRDNLVAALAGVFDSQISGGKRYDLASVGRRLANATFLESHAVDATRSSTFAIDLTPVVHDESVDVIDYVESFIAEFRSSVVEQLRTMKRK